MYFSLKRIVPVKVTLGFSGRSGSIRGNRCYSRREENQKDKKVLNPYPAKDIHLLYGSACDISELITCAQMLPLKVNADISTRARSFGLSLHLHPYFVYASSKGSDKSGHLCRLS